MTDDLQDQIDEAVEAGTITAQEIVNAEVIDETGEPDQGEEPASA